LLKSPTRRNLRGVNNMDYKPKVVPIVKNNNGYPNNVANTQTVKTRGTGAATKGTHSSKKLG
jgi:hypothetical protein